MDGDRILLVDVDEADDGVWCYGLAHRTTGVMVVAGRLRFDPATGTLAPIGGPPPDPFVTAALLVRQRRRPPIVYLCRHRDYADRSSCGAVPPCGWRTPWTTRHPRVRHSYRLSRKSSDRSSVTRPFTAPMVTRLLSLKTKLATSAPVRLSSTTRPSPDNREFRNLRAKLS